MKKKSQQASSDCVSTKPSYFQSHIAKAARVIFAKCQNDFMEMSMRSTDDAVKAEFNRVKEKLNEVQMRVKGEINGYLDELF